MNNYFCVMPFFGMEYITKTDRTTACCLLPPRVDIEHVKSAMLEGKRPSECNACWKLEDQNLTSDRQTKNAMLDFYANRDINFIEADCKKGNYSKQIIKIPTSNLCNSTCLTCNANASSAWGALRGTVEKKYIIRDEQLSIPDYPNLKMLSFVGGEPLYEKKNFEILQKVIDSGNTDCFISLVTNGSVELTDKQISILKKFKNVNLCVSIDGIKSVFEYMRFPLKWDILVKNLELYRTLTPLVSVSYTISNTNIMYYSETVEWFADQNLDYNHNIVSSPNYFCPSNLTPIQKTKILESNPNYKNELSDILDINKEFDNELYYRFKQEINTQDCLKNINIKNYLPEFAKLL
ncbi:AslB Arylsulfatase regulator (Fe-S oxidoreductase) [uncultured Caudovirales phage]|uniref:AslB Arylsulfatase regulator (Fe-S oxidoreductase) n=1 Tax=uncultured Caudovirales phage TaxID=2100421 RepID=A0A6J5LGI0_9CAUD|nr:AslB Arylsulfatase regulator (Fe-S oxidoreductase) [uncultured Caudovirales phage]